MTILRDEWQNCYPSNWKGLIVPAAIKHPAKFSSRLIVRIYEHMEIEGWIEPGDTILDPFGGVALGALDAMRRGLRWRGNELEANFAALGNQNIEMWNRRFSIMPHWCQDAKLLNGDSRRLLEILREADGAVSSPPYADTPISAQGAGDDQSFNDAYREFRRTGDHSAFQAAMNKESRGAGYSNAADGSVSSPPYADSMERTGAGFDPALTKRPGGPNSQMVNANTGYSEVAGALSSPPYAEARIGQESGQEQCGRGDQYGSTEGQLGAMKAEGFEAALSSSPFSTPQTRDRSPVSGGDIADFMTRAYTVDRQGVTEGNLAAMPIEGFDAALSSPPYGGMPVEKNSKSIDREKQYEVYRASGGGQSFEAFCATQELHSGGYGDSEGQLSHMPTAGYDDAVSSPPFLQARGGTPEPKAGGTIDAGVYARHAAGNAAANGYGETEGQLSSMSEQGYDDAVSSPPFEKQFASHDNFIAPHDSTRLMDTGAQAYGDTHGNIGNDSGDSFWMAARTIVDQVYAALKPGGHAVWVVKGFVKDGAVVDFPGQWQRLCEAAGFQTLHIHHAMLINRQGASYTLEGDLFEHKTEAKSFFRRNGENKARAAKWWDTADVSRETKAEWIQQAHALKWQKYRDDLEKNPGRKIKPPKRYIILGKAQSMAYEAAGAPDIEISTSIDYEVVLCQVKAEA